MKGDYKMARERKMVAGKLFMWELDEAAHAYLDFCECGEDTENIMNLVQGSSKSVEKKFWAMVDKARKAQSK
jgi:hypothetical protein